MVLNLFLQRLAGVDCFLRVPQKSLVPDWDDDALWLAGLGHDTIDGFSGASNPPVLLGELFGASGVPLAPRHSLLGREVRNEWLAAITTADEVFEALQAADWQAVDPHIERWSEQGLLAGPHLVFLLSCLAFANGESSDDLKGLLARHLKKLASWHHPIEGLLTGIVPLLELASPTGRRRFLALFHETMARTLMTQGAVTEASIRPLLEMLHGSDRYRSFIALRLLFSLYFCGLSHTVLEQEVILGIADHLKRGRPLPLAVLFCDRMFPLLVCPGWEQYFAEINLAVAECLKNTDDPLLVNEVIRFYLHNLPALVDRRLCAPDQGSDLLASLPASFQKVAVRLVDDWMCRGLIGGDSLGRLLAVSKDDPNGLGQEVAQAVWHHFAFLWVSQRMTGRTLTALLDSHPWEQRMACDQLASLATYPPWFRSRMEWNRLAWLLERNTVRRFLDQYLARHSLQDRPAVLFHLLHCLESLTDSEMEIGKLADLSLLPDEWLEAAKKLLETDFWDAMRDGAGLEQWKLLEGMKKSQAWHVFLQGKHALPTFCLARRMSHEGLEAARRLVSGLGLEGGVLVFRGRYAPLTGVVPESVLSALPGQPGTPWQERRPLPPDTDTSLNLQQCLRLDLQDLKDKLRKFREEPTDLQRKIFAALDAIADSDETLGEHANKTRMAIESFFNFVMSERQSIEDWFWHIFVMPLFERMTHIYLDLGEEDDRTLPATLVVSATVNDLLFHEGAGPFVKAQFGALPEPLDGEACNAVTRGEFLLARCEVEGRPLAETRLELTVDEAGQVHLLIPAINGIPGFSRTEAMLEAIGDYAMERLKIASGNIHIGYWSPPAEAPASLDSPSRKVQARQFRHNWLSVDDLRLLQAHHFDPLLVSLLHRASMASEHSILSLHYRSPIHWSKGDEAWLEKLGIALVRVNAFRRSDALTDPTGFYAKPVGLVWHLPVAPTDEAQIAALASRSIRSNVRRSLARAQTYRMARGPLTVEEYRIWYALYGQQQRDRPRPVHYTGPNDGKKLVAAGARKVFLFDPNEQDPNNPRLVAGAILSRYGGSLEISYLARDSTVAESGLTARLVFGAIAEAREGGWTKIGYGRDINLYGHHSPLSLFFWKSQLGFVPEAHDPNGRNCMEFVRVLDTRPFLGPVFFMTFLDGQPKGILYEGHGLEPGEVEALRRVCGGRLEVVAPCRPEITGPEPELSPGVTPVFPRYRPYQVSVGGKENDFTK